MKEIKEKIHQHLDFYVGALSQYSEEDFFRKPSETAWSIGQLYEHLVMSSTLFMKQVQRCLGKEKAQQGGEKNENGENIYKYQGFPPVKITPPSAYQVPVIARQKEVYVTELTNFKQIFESLFDAVSQDEGIYKTLHPALGFLNAYEWYIMQEFHLRHHLRQKQEIDAFLKA